jgi:transcription elongation factor SPT5
MQLNFDMDNIGYEDLMDYLPLEGGLDNNVFFDSMSGMATGHTQLF